MLNLTLATSGASGSVSSRNPELSPIPMRPLQSPSVAMAIACLIAMFSASSAPAPAGGEPGPHRQLPRVMHGTMTELPRVTVGIQEGDFSGKDNRVLQAAVDYVGSLGGGVVEIGDGEFQMRDSLHLRAHVTVRGHGAKTILKKARAASSALELDGDFGEEQITVKKPEGFAVGDGVAVWDNTSYGFHRTVARITGRNGNTFSLSVPLISDCLVGGAAVAATVYPVISGQDLDGVRVESLTIEGNQAENVNLDGCRGGGIYLYRCSGAVIDHCTVRHYHGDGISFQQSNDVTVTGCVSEGNVSLGFHPGSGSQRPVVRDCIARGNGDDGLYLCWRVKNGVFEGNTLEGNGRYGISIGHKDTDNLLRNNKVLGNGSDGVFFRNESGGMAGHRNRIEDNLIENNGAKEPAAGIRVRGETRDLVFKGNTIRDTRTGEARRQTVGIRLDEQVGGVTTDGNRIDAITELEDRRAAR